MLGSSEELIRTIERVVDDRCKAAIGAAIPLSDERQVNLAYKIAIEHSCFPNDIREGAHALLRKSLGLPEKDAKDG